MKLCRIGDFNKEKPALIDKDNNYLDLSPIIKDFNPETLNFNTLNEIKKTDLSKLKKINPNIKLKSFKENLTVKNIRKIGQNFDIIVDGSDNFGTRFLINDYCFIEKKILVSGAISKFDGHVYTFNFTKQKSPCLRCFMPKIPNAPDIDNCEYEGVLATLGGIVGSIQANEVVKEILGIGQTLCGYILIIDGLKLSFRKVKLNKRSDCRCNEKK